VTTPSEGVGGLRRLHPLTPVFATVSSTRQVVTFAIATLALGGPRLLLVLALLQLGVQVLAWRRRSYAFDGEVLRIDSGLLSRSQELVPAHRIQQVTVVQKARHRVAGVAELRVETAGGGGGGPVLEVVAAAEADRLRRALLAAKAATRPSPRPPTAGEVGGGEAPAEWVPRPWPVLSLGHRQLAVAGLTGAELLVVFAAVASLLQVVDDLPGGFLQRLRPPEAALSPAGLAVGLVVFVVVWLGSAVAASVLRDGGYTLTLLGDELHLRRGLLDRKEGVLPLERVQAVRVTASPLRRALGLVSLRFQSAGRGTDREESRIDVPVLPGSDLDRVLDLAVPGSAPVPTLRSPPRPALRRALVRRLVPAGIVAVPLVVAGRVAGAVVAGVVLVGAALWGVAAYRALGHAVDGGFLYARSGAVVRRLVVVPMGRAQSASVVRSPFQRPLGLATLQVDLAGPGRRPRVLDEAEEVASASLHRVVAAVGAREPAPSPVPAGRVRP
jgi:putative membrane protein